MNVFVPTINDDPQDFDKLFGLWQQVTAFIVPQVVFRFHGCRFLRHNGVAFLGGLVRLCQLRGTQVVMDWGSLQSNIRRNLEQNGFMAALGSPIAPWAGNSIPFREHHGTVEASKRDITHYLRQRWLGPAWMRCSDALANMIAGKVWEIYCNAFEHSGSQAGIFSCGQHYPRLHTLSLSVVDFGTGIPEKVRTFTGRSAMRASETLAWAFFPGHTTTSTGSGRGLGLDFLSKFVTLNRGELNIYSENGRAEVSPAGQRFSDRGSGFSGTIVDIRLQCDEKYYVLATETAGGPLF